jgi:transposase
MTERRRKYDPEFRDGAVRVVRGRGKTTRQAADDLGINLQTLGNWVARHSVASETQVARTDSVIVSSSASSKPQSQNVGITTRLAVCH